MPIAFSIELGTAAAGRVLVRIGNHDEVGVAPASNGLELVGIALPHPLLPGLDIKRQPHEVDLASREPSLAEEPPNESLVSAIFAK